MGDGINNEVFDCPRGCGTMEYQSTAGSFQSGYKGLVGMGLIIASVTIFVTYIVWLFTSGNGTNENLDTGQLFMVGIICTGILVLGANIECEIHGTITVKHARESCWIQMSPRNSG